MMGFGSRSGALRVFKKNSTPLSRRCSVLLTTLLTPGVAPQSYDLDDNTRAHAFNVTAVTSDSQHLVIYLNVDYQKSAVSCQSAPKKPWSYCSYIITGKVYSHVRTIRNNKCSLVTCIVAPDVLLIDYVVSAVDADLRDRVSAALLAETAATNDNKWLSELNPGPCPSGPHSCPPSKYRASEGVCNNVRHPQWGSRGSPFLRLLSPNYQDGKYRDPGGGCGSV
uniref:Uncharacterized protein n=1 Tax=Timema douglasi TaxID=61478 RepID=A0A7R8VYU3_TIMDO|nr:unnamed protein product [Timema douglasi]